MKKTMFAAWLALGGTALSQTTVTVTGDGAATVITAGIQGPAGGTVPAGGIEGSLAIKSGTGFAWSSALTETTIITSTKSLIVPIAGYLEIGVGKVRFHSYTAAGATGQNIFIGENTGNSTMTAPGFAYQASRNVGIGPGVLSSLTTGFFNYGIGYNALHSTTTGAGNTAIGGNALPANLIGWDNVAIADDAMLNHTEGDWNNAVGHNALYQDLTGVSNNAFGHDALRSNTAGVDNVAIGESAGYSSTGSTNVFIGHDSGYYETGSGVLFIDNNRRLSEADGRTKALIYGTFNALPANQLFRVNGAIQSYLPNANAFGLILTDTSFGATPLTSFALMQRTNGNGSVWNNNVEAIRVSTTGRVGLLVLSSYANNAAALAGGLIAGDIYTVSGTDPRQLAVVY